MDFFGVLPRKSKQTPNAVPPLCGSQNVGAKLHVREGISPDRNLRSLNVPDPVGTFLPLWRQGGALSASKEVGILGQLGGWLRGSHPLKSA